MSQKRHIPERTCVGCFQKKERDKLVAVTRQKNGVVLMNPGHKIAGRSAYLCPDKSCVAKAQKRKGRDGLFFTLKVKAPEEIWAELQQLINN